MNLRLTITLLLSLAASSLGHAEHLTLRECVDTALDRNLDLKVVRTGERISGYRLNIERARFDPAITALSGYSDRLSPSGGSALEGAPQNATSRGDVTFGVEAELATGGKIGLSTDVFDRTKTNSAFASLNPAFDARTRLEIRQPLLQNAGFTYNLSPIRLAELNLDRSNLESQLQLIEVLREIEFAYWLVVATNRAVDIRRNAIELGELILEESVEREKASLSTRIDILEARAAVAEKEEALLRSNKLHADAIDNLYKVMGVLEDEEPPAILTLENLPVNLPYRPNARESFDLALANSPIRLIALNAMRAREIERRRAKSEALPRLDFVGSSGLLGRDADQGEAFDRLGEGDGYFWEVGLEFRLPWGRRAEKARYAEAVTQLERERLTTDQITLQLYADIRAACREVTLAFERLDATRVTQELNVEKFEQRETEQRSGQTTVRVLLETQEEMEESQLRHLESNVELLDAITNLAQLEGTLPRRYGLSIAEESAP